MSDYKFIHIIIFFIGFGFYGNAQQKDKYYLFINYFYSEEFFPNALFFVPVDSILDTNHQLFSTLNDTTNRIYFDIEYFILHNEDSIDYAKTFISSIMKDSSTVIYSSKENNIIIQLFKSNIDLGKFYWNQRSPTAIPLFCIDKNKLRRAYSWVESRYVLKNIPIFTR